MFKHSLIALSLLSLLTGCSLDGDDGATGSQGQQGVAGQDGNDGQNGTNGSDGQDGANGQDGTNGTNANSMLEISLVGRAVLNAESPEGAAEIVAYQASKNGYMPLIVQAVPLWLKLFQQPALIRPLWSKIMKVLLPLQI